MQTATDSIAPEAIAAKLEAWKSGISHIRTAEQDLIKNRAERMNVVRREMVQREESGVEKHKRRIQQLAQERHRAIEQEAARRVERAARIQTVYHASRASLADRAQGAKDRQIGRAQGGIMRRRQARQDELKHATVAHQEFQQQLAGDCTTRRILRKSAIKAFRPFIPVVGKRFIGEIRKAPAPIPAETPEKTRALLLEKLREISGLVESADREVLTRFFRIVPLWLLMLPLPFLHFPTVMRHGFQAIPWQAVVFPACIVLGFWGVSLILALPSFRKLVESLYAAKCL